MQQNPSFNSRPSIWLRAFLLGISLCSVTVRAEDPAPTAAALAASLSAGLQDGSAVVRLKLDVRQPTAGGTTALQLQIKSRRTKAATELVYQVLWPKERKGESFLVRKTPGNAATGSIFLLPDTLRPLTAAQLKEGIFGSDLAYEDLVENFYSWEHQAVVGTESIGRLTCQILESKPGKGDHSSYSVVRSWIDPKKMVPMRIEKFVGGQMVRRIETTRVAEDDTDRPVPASLSVQRAGKDSVTELEGSKSRHGVTFTDADFAPEGLKTVTTPK
jgi:hypothetical protein